MAQVVSDLWRRLFPRPPAGFTFVRYDDAQLTWKRLRNLRRLHREYHAGSVEVRSFPVKLVVEATNVYLRNDVFRPILREDTDRFTPLLWTFFWFFLLGHLFGLIPLRDLTWLLHIRDTHGHGIGGTATQSIWVTAALALMASAVLG